MKRTQTNRGQLILAGAVSFALILIAIAVVFSTTLFTASVGSSGSVETVSDSTGVEQSVNKTTAELLNRTTSTGFEENMSTYGRLLENSSAESSPTFVNITVIDTATPDASGELDWAKVRIVYETSSVQRETTINVSAP